MQNFNQHENLVLDVGRIKVKNISAQQVEELIQVHNQAFCGYLNTQLGYQYLKTFMLWFINAANGISLGAFDDKDRLLGYVIGAPVGYRGELEKRIFVPAIIGVLTHFWIILKPRFLNMVFAKLGFRNSTQLSKQPVLPMPAMSLVGIGVLPSARGNKVGETLMLTFEKQSVLRGMKALRLSVYPDNVSARKLYEKMNWLPYVTSSQTSGAMYYYKLLTLAEK